jgi:beta-aspartyl-peptidase (threonine type)
MYAIAIHGGAGPVPRAMLSELREQRFRAGLEAALDGGCALLARGGSSLDAVSAAVRRTTRRSTPATAPP